MQDALERWSEVENSLRGEFDALEADSLAGVRIDERQLMAAMPRSYQFLDASAFLAHNHILAEAWGYERRTLADPPLMYQGLSDRFLPPHGEVSFRDVADDIDFEAEFGVLTDAVPRGTTATAALGHVCLLVLINDWSLRAFGPAEMKGGFGFLHAKPWSTLSPFAVTPDELGDDWRQGKLHVALTIRRNGALFGRPHGREMSYDFGSLISHAAATRDLCAGTVLGSGTVSNGNAMESGSGCIAERRALDQVAGAGSMTEYLQDGDHVVIEARTPLLGSIFGALDQVIKTER